MKHLTRRLAAAILLLLAATAAHARPIDDCRGETRQLMTDMQSDFNKAWKDYRIVGDNRVNFENSLKQLAPTPGAGGTLKQCKAKTTELKNLKQSFPGLLTTTPPEVVACRNANLQQLKRLHDARLGYQRAISSANSAEFTRHLAGIAKYNLDAEKRGYTTADCQQASKLSDAYIGVLRKVCHQIVAQGGRVQWICIVQ